MGNKVSYKSHTSLPQAVAYLEEMIKHLKEGKACIQHDREFVTLTPVNDVSLEVEAAAKKGKESLSIELKWRQETGASASDTELRISAEEPETGDVEDPSDNPEE